MYDKLVDKLENIFDANFIDPFGVMKTPNKLINFATGVHATDEIEKSLTECFETGAKMFETFVSERLVIKTDGSDPPEKNFFTPMPRSNIKTMAEMKKKHVFKTKSEIIIGEVMFQRLLAINAYKKIPLERVFSFENTMVPLSMFTEQGQMHKSKKSDFMSKLEDLLPGNTATIENADTVIFDGMAVIQLLQVQSAENTFLDMAAFFLKYILMKARAIPGEKYVHIVFDKYKKLSPKSDTRRDRGDIAATNIHINSYLRVPKDWKQFLCSGTNKERLAEYYTGYIKEKASCHLKAHEILFINGGNDEICLKVNTDDCTEIQTLKSNQEEADTLMILHACKICGRHWFFFNSNTVSRYRCVGFIDPPSQVNWCEVLVHVNRSCQCPYRPSAIYSCSRFSTEDRR